MPNRLVSLVTRRRPFAAHPKPPLPAEPIQLVARKHWHQQSSIAGDGFRLQALRCSECALPGRIGIKPIPLVGAGAAVLDPGDADVDTSDAYATGQAVLRLDFERPSLIRNLDLGLLFDGPEYSDWEEAARIDVTFAGSTIAQRCTLYTSFVNAGYASCSWDGGAVPWTSSGAWSGGPGLWLNADPFDGRAVTRLDLHATQAGASDDDDPLRPRQRRSDYVLRSLEALACPDAATLAQLTDAIGHDGPQRSRA
ncbi:MAG: hypothetical protein MUF07_11185 [Steroidobacteraceae bacterium]|jgi:hypothetical protein|nr:hypothetical protein [Steroidobacteraceae bacterium]